MLATTAFLLYPGAMLSYSLVWPLMQPSLASSFYLRILVCPSTRVFTSHQSYSFLDIERFYGQRKPIAKRVPIVTKPKSVDITPKFLASTNDSAIPPVLEPPTPPLTECESATTNLDTELDDMTPNENTLGGLSRHRKTLSGDSVTSSNGDITPLQSLSSNKIASRPRTKSSSTRRKNSVSQHDLLNKYFKRDAVVLRNIDILRYVPGTWLRNLI